MRIVSADRTVSILLASPGLGFVVTIAEHAWFFDRDSRIVTSVLPESPMQHKAGIGPEHCAACSKFIARDWRATDGGI